MVGVKLSVYPAMMYRKVSPTVTTNATTDARVRALSSALEAMQAMGTRALMRERREVARLLQAAAKECHRLMSVMPRSL